MDRLTKEQIEICRIELKLESRLTHAEADTLCDLALQSLSQEAVREEAVREIINELAAIADACVDLQQNRKRPDSDPVMGWDNAPLTLGTLRKARALKREPNAAAQVDPLKAASTEQSASGSGRPAPAAPDVASMVKELTAQRIADGANETGLLGRAAALLARLGEGAPLSADYIQTVPDKCDRIIWRGRYYHLPLAPGASDD